jgi:hypothetical protein
MPFKDLDLAHGALVTAMSLWVGVKPDETGVSSITSPSRLEVELLSPRQTRR